MIAAPLAIDLSAHEFTIPCGGRQCGEPAEYAVWMAHAQRLGCDVMVYSCASHLHLAEQGRISALQDGRNCPHCSTPIVGQLSDHLRSIEL